MKKIVFVLLTAVLSLTVTAQEKKHEIDLGIGIWSSNEIIGTLSDIIVQTIPVGLRMDDGSYIGALHAGYKYSITERFALGGVFGFDYGKSDALRNNVEVGKFYNYYYTLAAEADFKYINRNLFRLYSLIGIGGTLLHQTYEENITGDKEKNDHLYFNFQVTPIGVKVGNSFGGFAELGFGYKGIICVGLFSRF